jgi:hypothetical protein
MGISYEVYIVLSKKVKALIGHIVQMAHFGMSMLASHLVDIDNQIMGSTSVYPALRGAVKPLIGAVDM